jgi:bifunctional UDP-N-acetylglucosamine pyrophosphorylase/glucosamine-1-phosphate N-acetyltransferase
LQENRRLTAVILAAGMGTRMKSDLPKVLHEVCGRPMLAYVVDACCAAGVESCIVVIGYGKDRVIEAVNGRDHLTFVEQVEQLGTGHAVMVCRDHLAGRFDDTLIVCGDGPLIRPETIRTLVESHQESGAAATLATAELDDPAGYGRILRNGAGDLIGIVEQRDCTPEQLRIREVNPSYYCFRTDDLLWALDRIDNDNAKGEYYITDTLGVLIRDGRRVTAITAVPPEDVYSINTHEDLARVEDVMRDRISSEARS